MFVITRPLFRMRIIYSVPYRTHVLGQRVQFDAKREQIPVMHCGGQEEMVQLTYSVLLLLIANE